MTTMRCSRCREVVPADLTDSAAMTTALNRHKRCRIYDRRRWFWFAVATYVTGFTVGVLEDFWHIALWQVAASLLGALVLIAVAADTLMRRSSEVSIRIDDPPLRGGDSR